MAALKLFSRLFLRPMRREALRTLLMALSVALGVAVVLAIELAGDAAAGSFRASVETLAGKADYEVTVAGGVPPEALARLTTLPYNLKLQSRMESGALVEPARRAVPLLGVDMVAGALEAGLPVNGGAPADGLDPAWVGIDLARELGLRAGGTLQLVVNDQPVRLRVAGVLGAGSADAVVMDLAPLSRILNNQGRLDRILIQIPSDEPGADWPARLSAALPAGVNLAAAGSRTSANRKMLEAFRWNLRVLSYIALIVGAFLIYNTISVSVVRRRAEIGILRAVGATRGGVLAAFLGEAALIGLLGSLAGLALGRLLASGAVGMVAATSMLGPSQGQTELPGKISKRDPPGDEVDR